MPLKSILCATNKQTKFLLIVERLWDIAGEITMNQKQAIMHIKPDTDGFMCTQANTQVIQIAT